MRQPTISDARSYGRRLGARGVMLLAIDDEGEVQGVSWGWNRRECDEMGALLDQLFAALGIEPGAKQEDALL